MLEHEVNVEVLLHRGLVQLHPALSRHALNLKPVKSYFAMKNRPSSELVMIFAEGDLVPSTNNSVFSTLSISKLRNSCKSICPLWCAPLARRRVPVRWGLSCSGRGPWGSPRTPPPPSAATCARPPGSRGQSWRRPPRRPGRRGSTIYNQKYLSIYSKLTQHQHSNEISNIGLSYLQHHNIYRVRASNSSWPAVSQSMSLTSSPCTRSCFSRKSTPMVFL